MYTKAKLKDEAGQEKEILTFGPLCIKKEYQRKGYGKKPVSYTHLDVYKRQLEEEGNKRAAKLKKLTEQPAKFLATIQVAITL